VEDALYLHPAVADCGVIGVPDDTWGEVGRAVVVLHDGVTAEPGDLIEFLAERIARFKVPRSVAFTDSIPRTASGKVNKTELRSRFA
jgi:fatty-acyl-CoA synthase